MAAVKKKKINIYVIAFIFFCGLLLLIFNNDGLIKYLRLQNEVTEIKEQISEVEKENKSLEGEIDSLQKKSPAKVEKIAREKHNMIREGETTIKVTEE